jgi:hypothetical protein
MSRTSKFSLKVSDASHERNVVSAVSAASISFKRKANRDQTSRKLDRMNRGRWKPVLPILTGPRSGCLDSASSQRGIGIVSVAPLGAELVFSILDQHLSFMTVIATPVSSVYGRVDGLSLSAIGPVVLILMGDFPLIVVEHDEILGSCHELNSRR